MLILKENKQKLVNNLDFLKMLVICHKFKDGSYIRTFFEIITQKSIQLKNKHIFNIARERFLNPFMPK